MSIQVRRAQVLQQFTQLELLDALVQTLPSPGDSYVRDSRYDGEAILGLLASAVRQRHNESCPINCVLPNELLAEIFLQLPIRSSDRMVASQTCRHWRDVALSTPQLWTHIDFNRPQRSATFLKRSKSAPLFITLYLPKPSDLDVIGPYSHRIQSLDLGVGTSGDLSASVFPSTPNLRQLGIRGHCGIDASFILPVIFSSEKVPRLEKLTLRYAFPPWSCLVFRGLKHLVLEGTRGNAQPSIHEVQTVLQNNPGLEVFQFTTNEPLARSDLPSQQIIHLPNMERFELHCLCPSDVRDLHGSVAIPTSARVKLRSTFPNPSINILAMLDSKEESLPLTRLSLHLAERGKGVRIEGFTANGAPLIDIGLDCPTSSMSDIFCVSGLDEAIYLKDVESLEIRSQRCPALILQKMPRLQRLLFNHVRDANQSLEGLVMPELRSLTLHHTDISGEGLLAIVSANRLEQLECRFNVGPFEHRIVGQVLARVPSASIGLAG